MIYSSTTTNHHHPPPPSATSSSATAPSIFRTTTPNSFSSPPTSSRPSSFYASTNNAVASSSSRSPSSSGAGGFKVVAGRRSHPTEGPSTRNDHPTYGFRELGNGGGLGGHGLLGGGLGGGGGRGGGSETGLTTEEEGGSEVGSLYSREGEVVETETITTSTDPYTGRKCLNQYAILNELGKGQHGKVRLARDMDTNTLWAVKIISRQQKKRLPGFSSAPKQPVQPGEIEDKLKKEIAILKKLRHPHVVRLREVIDAKEHPKVFLVLEYMEGGEVKWKSDDQPPTPLLTTEQTRRMFRDVVLGLEYLHHQGIIHRDIKPANLLWNQDHSVVKISDFGVSHYSSVLRLASGLDDGLEGTNPDAFIALDEEALAKTAGSPAFFAPELCYNGETTPLAPSSPASSDHRLNGDNFFSSPHAELSRSSQTTLNRQAGLPSPSYRGGARRERPKVTKAIDVWALGVTLYCLLFAKVPFEAPTEFALFAVIPNEDYDVPEFAGKERFETGGRYPKDGASWEARELADLLQGMLEKNPEKRMKLDEIKRHRWVLRGIENFDHWLASTDPGNDFVTVTKDEVASAFTETLSSRIKRTASKFKNKLFHTSSSTSSSVSRPSRSRAHTSAGIIGNGDYSEDSLVVLGRNGSTSGSVGKLSAASSPAIRQVGLAGGILSPPNSRGSSSAHLHQGSRGASASSERPSSPSESPAASARHSFFFLPSSSQSGSPRFRSKELTPETSPPSSRYSMPSSPSLAPIRSRDHGSLDRSQSVKTSPSTSRGLHNQPPLRRLSNHLLPVKRLLAGGSDREFSSAPLSPSGGRSSMDLHPNDRSQSSNALAGTSRSRSPLPPTPHSPTVARRTLGPDEPAEKQPGKLARFFGRRKHKDRSPNGGGEVASEVESVVGTSSAHSQEGGNSPAAGYSSFPSDEDHGSSVRSRLDAGPAAPPIVLGSLPRLEDDQGGLGIHFTSRANGSDDHHSNLSSSPPSSNHQHLHGLSPLWPAGAHRFGQAPSSADEHQSSNRFGLPLGETLDIEDDLDFSDDDDQYGDDFGVSDLPVRRPGGGGLPRTVGIDFRMGRDGWKASTAYDDHDRRSLEEFTDAEGGVGEDDSFDSLRPAFSPIFPSPKDRKRSTSSQHPSISSGTPSTIRRPRSNMYNNTPSPSPSPPTSPANATQGGRFPPLSVGGPHHPSTPSNASPPSPLDSTPTNNRLTIRTTSPTLIISSENGEPHQLRRKSSMDRSPLLSVASPGARARSPLGMEVESSRSPWRRGVELNSEDEGSEDDEGDEEDEGLEVSIGKNRSMHSLPAWAHLATPGAA